MNKVPKAHEGTTGLAAEQRRQVRMLEARNGVLENTLDSLNQKKPAGCHMEAVSR